MIVSIDRRLVGRCAGVSVVVVAGWNSPVAWTLEDDVTAGDTLDAAVKLRAWMGEVGVLLKICALRGVSEVFEWNLESVEIAST